MAQKVIGRCACPLCGYADQEIRESDKNGKPYMVCDECGCQIFARQARSVKLLRDKASAAPAEIAREVKPSVPDAPKPAAPKEPTLLGKLWNAPMFSEEGAAI
jgi:hypothetical protein